MFDDISDEMQVKQIAKDLKNKNYIVNVLVNNADMNPKMKKYKILIQEVEDYSIDQLTKEISVGVIGTFICSKLLVNMKKNRKGSIINVSSDLGITAPDQKFIIKVKTLKK